LYLLKYSSGRNGHIPFRPHRRNSGIIRSNIAAPIRHKDCRNYRKDNIHHHQSFVSLLFIKSGGVGILDISYTASLRIFINSYSQLTSAAIRQPSRRAHGLNQ
jgi:hypothetical protein